MEVAEELIKYGRGKLILIYGMAGSGKTNLALYLLSLYGRISRGKLVNYYVSTEGSMYAHLIPRYEDGLDNVLFTEAVNLDHLLEIVLRLYLRKDTGMIVIDSVNNHYRLEVLINKRATTLLNLILALLRSISLRSGSPALVTAQTTIDEDGSVRVSGEHILRFWSDLIIKLEYDRTLSYERVACIEYPNSIRGRCFTFTIGESGVMLKQHVDERI